MSTMDRLQYEATHPTRAHRGTVVWLHGIGQAPGDLMAVTQRFRLAEAGVRGVFPRAQVSAPSLLSGLAVPCWFPQNLLAIDRIGAGRIVLAGFSQGATVALTMALTYTRRLAGVALYAPFVPPDLPALLPAGGPSPAGSGLPVWIGHGARDWVVPERSGAVLRDLLTDWGHPVTWQRYPGGHEPFAGVRASLPAYLSDVLNVHVPRVPGAGPAARAR